MASRFFIFIVSGFVILVSAGCGMKSRVYAVDRPRLDQVNTGNAGYIGGDKKESGPIAERSTRRIYVFEFDKKKKPEVVADTKKADVSSSSASVAATDPESVKPSKEGITLPYIGDDEPASRPADIHGRPLQRVKALGADRRGRRIESRCGGMGRLERRRGPRARGSTGARGARRRRDRRG